MTDSDDTDDDCDLVANGESASSVLFYDNAKDDDLDNVERKELYCVTKSLNKMEVTPLAVCTQDGCALKNDRLMLECSKCKRRTHYACTKLPPYQITLFLQKSYRLYICTACVGDIHQDILENCYEESSFVTNKVLTGETNLVSTGSNVANEENLSSSVKLLTHKVKYLEKELEISNEKLAKHQERESTKIVSHCYAQTDDNITKEITHKVSISTQACIISETEMETENKISCLMTELDRLNDEKSKQRIIIAQLKEKTQDFEEQSKENEGLSKRLSDLKVKLDNKVKENNNFTSKNKTLQTQLEVMREHETHLELILEEREKTIDETHTKLVEMEQADTINNNINPSLDLKKLINDRFNKIEDSIHSIITKKLAESTSGVQQIEAKIEEVIDINKTYATTLKSGSDSNKISTIIKATKNDELVQASERERRSTNFIIYGMKEETDKTSDQLFVHSFLDILGITSRPKLIIRLGKKDENKKRPVKVIMNSSNEKDSVMSRLMNLKNADEIYRSLSITDDYTVEERDQIREWVHKANTKNEGESTNTWKVRGTPKNGLRLVKITKRR